MFVKRDEQGAVVSAYARPQPGVAEEYLPEDHADALTFKERPRPETPISAEELYDMLNTKGVLTAGDRPRPKPGRL